MIPLARFLRNVGDPRVQARVYQVDDQFHLQDIANEIRQDQVISAKVIRFCNSAFFGLKTRIDSIDRALVMLGEKQFLQLVIGRLLAYHIVAVQDTMGVGINDEYGKMGRI